MEQLDHAAISGCRDLRPPRRVRDGDDVTFRPCEFGDVELRQRSPVRRQLHRSWRNRAPCDQAPDAAGARLRPQELGSAFLCADLELTPEVRDDHASYIASWLEVLKNDNCAIFGAAAHAQRAVDYLHKLQPERIEAAA